MHRYEKLVKCLTSDAETSIKQAATQAQDMEVIGRVQEDLRARETYYTNHVDETSWSKLRDVCKQLQRKIVILLRRKLLMKMHSVMSVDTLRIESLVHPKSRE